MGLWDSLKKVGVAAKCGVGWHAGDYERVEGKPECFMAKTCPDCRQYVTKNDHTFGDWQYQEYGNCRQFCSCIHCGYQKTEVIHDFEEHGKNEECRIIEICRVCNHKELGRAQHNWIQIPFTNKDVSIKGQKKCGDCGFIG